MTTTSLRPRIAECHNTTEVANTVETFIRTHLTLPTGVEVCVTPDMSTTGATGAIYLQLAFAVTTSAGPVPWVHTDEHMNATNPASFGDYLMAGPHDLSPEFAFLDPHTAQTWFTVEDTKRAVAALVTGELPDPETDREAHDEELDETFLAYVQEHVDRMARNITAWEDALHDAMKQRLDREMQTVADQWKAGRDTNWGWTPSDARSLDEAKAEWIETHEILTSDNEFAGMDECVYIDEPDGQVHAWGVSLDAAAVHTDEGSRHEYTTSIPLP